MKLPNKNWFWSIKNSGDVLCKLKRRGFFTTNLSTYDFSTLYTTQSELRKTARFDRVDLPNSIITMVFGVEIFFLIAPFPDRCLLAPFYIRVLVDVLCGGHKKSPRTSI